MKAIRHAVLIWLFVAATICFGDVRPEATLNGDWQVCAVDSIGEGKPDLAAAKWQSTDVPNAFESMPCAWWKREFSVPSSMAGKRIKLKFERVTFKAVVYVNGVKVGGHFGPETPFEVDITKVAKFGASNELLVGVTDGNTATQNGKLCDITWKMTWNGIWGDVTLAAYPKVYIEDIWCEPSYRKRALDLEVTIANESNTDFTGSLACDAIDGKAIAKRFTPTVFRVKAAKRAVLKLSFPWQDAKPWNPETQICLLCSQEY